MTSTGYILVKIMVVGCSCDKRWNSGVLYLYLDKKNKAFGSVLTDPISPKNPVIHSPCLTFSWETSDDLHQQMQQVACKEGFMKGSVQLCSIDETPGPCQTWKIHQSNSSKMSDICWHFVWESCPQFGSYMLISNCAFMSTESFSLEINHRCCESAHFSMSVSNRYQPLMYYFAVNSLSVARSTLSVSVTALALPFILALSLLLLLCAIIVCIVFRMPWDVSSYICLSLSHHWPFFHFASFSFGSNESNAFHISLPTRSLSWVLHWDLLFAS